MSWLTRVRESASLYPITALWVAGSVLLTLVVNTLISLPTALLIFLTSALFALLGATWRELKAVHAQLDGQTTALIERIDRLSSMLSAHDIPVPPTSPKEHEARVVQAEKREVTA